MRLARRFALLGALVLMCVSLWRGPTVQAQSCGSADPNLFAGTCSGTKTDCLTSAAASRDACYGNCDTTYGYGTPSDTSCRTTCTNNYTTNSANCNTAYNSCISSRQQNCSATCVGLCSNTTGPTCCAYVDSYSGCSYACGCYTPAPPGCPNPYCNGTQWQCSSPIVMDVDGEGFLLTSPENGVWFDLFGDKNVRKWSWTAAERGNGFLVLDRNNNGVIDDGTELFGSVTPQPATASPNGFLALAVYDKPENGGNDDGFIDAQDAVFTKLRIWIDANHDGFSQPNELHTLSELGIARIDLQYQVKPKTDQYGNAFYLRGRVWDVHGQQAGRWAWDVYLKTQP